MPLVIFADGASSGNPGPGGWGAVIIDESRQVRELGGSERTSTNNRMELKAVHESLVKIRMESLAGAEVHIYTDSTYVIKGITQWIHGWRRTGWKTAEGKDVVNRELWEAIASELHALANRKFQWLFVPGHAGIAGNERVDEIAVLMRQNLEPALFSGDFAHYGVTDILNIPPKAELERLLAERDKNKKPSSSTGQGKNAYYLSFVAGSLEKHKTWPECEARVKGRSGAKFKKVSSSEEEKDVLKSWGVS
jgi:ribonuclease HI